MSLWLVRHAQPLVAPGTCYGALDVAADAQATARAAQALVPVLPQHLQVWVSPAQRCQQLAQALLALRPDLQGHTEPRIGEMDFGSWEGRAWEHLGPQTLDPWVADFGGYRCGGGESVNGLLQRVQSALAATPRPGIWVTHAGVIRAAILLAQGVTQVAEAAQWPTMEVACGTWVQL